MHLIAKGLPHLRLCASDAVDLAANGIHEIDYSFVIGPFVTNHGLAKGQADLFGHLVIGPFAVSGSRNALVIIKGKLIELVSYLM